MSDHTSTPSRPASPVGELPSFAAAARPFRFTWDASQRKPGPGSVSETTDGQGDYFAAGTVPYNFYQNTSAASLALGSIPAEWSSAKHGFNAISTVLNNPYKKSAPPKAHSALPSVPPADLPRVRRKDFDAYLAAVTPEYERFIRSVEQGREGAAQIEPASAASGLFAPDPNAVPVTPRTPRPPPGKPLPPLESVPSVFFDPAFHLGDPRTFAVVAEQHEDDEGDPSALAHALPLMEKLSHYADTIEQHLVREIALRSTSFFAALANLHDLQAESEQCVARIGRLRAELKEVDERGAKRGLEAVRREARMRNLDRVREGVREVQGVVEMVGVAKNLVGAGQWGEALNVIDGLDGLWHAESLQQVSQAPGLPRKDSQLSPLQPVLESPPQSPAASGPQKPPISVPLSSLKAFASLPDHLRTLTMEITSSLTAEFVNVLRLDLVERIDADISADRTNGMNTSLHDRLRPLLHSLARTKGVRDAVLAWRDVLLAEIRGTLRRRIPGFDLEDDEGNPRLSVTADLRAMSHPEFVETSRVMYRCLLNATEGVQRQGAAVIEVLQTLQRSKADMDISSLQEELTDILSSAAELANARASKVIAARSEQNAALSLPEFCIVFNESWDFVVKSEIICRRMIVGLRGTIVSQAKTFLQQFHQSQLTHSAKLVEDEQWSAAEVSPAAQRVVDLLVDASILDPLDFILNRPPPSRPSSPLPPHSPLPKSSSLSPSNSLNGSTGRPLSPSQSLSPSGTLSPTGSPMPTSPRAASPRARKASASAKHLRIDDRTYYVVSATQAVLQLLGEYLKIVINLPTLTTDTMGRVIELLKAFNSRTCQVVLGAGAMRSAGLKNITARHLALASQSLSIVITLVPYVRETFRRHLSQKQAVMLVEFDKLKRDYQEHQNEIHAKLIAIMGDRLSVHIKALQDIKWDVPPKGPGVNDYMETIVKDTVTLHKVLSRYLSSSIVEYVMTQVYAGINHRLSEEYTKIELPSQEAKERLLTDARYLHDQLAGLKNAGAPSQMLEVVVSEKAVARPGEPAPAPGIELQPQPPPHTPIANRFSRILNGRKATLPIPVPNMEKALPSPGLLSSMLPSFQQQQETPSTPKLEKTDLPSTPRLEKTDLPGTPSPEKAELPSTPKPEPPAMLAAQPAMEIGEASNPITPPAPTPEIREPQPEADAPPEAQTEAEAEELPPTPPKMDNLYPSIAETVSPSSSDEKELTTATSQYASVGNGEEASPPLSHPLEEES